MGKSGRGLCFADRSQFCFLAGEQIGVSKKGSATEIAKRTQTIGAGHLGSVNAGLRPHARIHIRASVPVVGITEHGTRITLPNEC